MKFTVFDAGTDQDGRSMAGEFYLVSLENVVNLGLIVYLAEEMLNFAKCDPLAEQLEAAIKRLD